jgi:hypothetical protein
MNNKRSHFAGGVLTPPLTKGDVQPPLETPFNGSTLKSAWSTIDESVLVADKEAVKAMDENIFLTSKQRAPIVYVYARAKASLAA